MALLLDDKRERIPMVMMMMKKKKEPEQEEEEEEYKIIISRFLLLVLCLCFGFFLTQYDVYEYSISSRYKYPVLELNQILIKKRYLILIVIETT